MKLYLTSQHRIALQSKQKGSIFGVGNFYGLPFEILIACDIVADLTQHKT
jgi:hypothetical protein